MSTAIVTGGAGFIGSHVVDALLAAGSQVVVIDDMSSGDPARVAAAAEVRELDIVQFDELRRVVDQAAPEAIYHLAAQASVVASVKDPGRDCEVNVRGTLNVLEAARGCGAPVVFTSTGGALYGDDAPRPTPETQPPLPLSPYGASKLAAEAYVRTWALSSGIPHTVCRLGNVYGPRQNPHGEAGVVAIFSDHLHTGRSPTLYGDGKPTRDYVYVSDVVDAMLAARGRAGTYNIATGAETDVLAIWTGLRDAAARVEPGLQPPEPQFADLRPGELQQSCLDVSLAQRELGWSARVPIGEGLELTYRALVEAFQKA
ncbi:MAG TPA: NAD-dependent epimerase/dehydratase family protein [Solirubrobacteraceae bacterium]|nr:NAD-dependent epimerase/dehydratase family protein [Solirubrobacteraceae bacterium]